MDIFFTDPSDVPLPPDEVRIRQFKAEPWPDGRRVKIYLEVTPFQKKPSGEVIITDISGQPVATASIIETIAPKMEINMHLRTPDPTGEFSVSIVLYYLQESEQEQDGEIISPPARMIVDEAQTTFEIDLRLEAGG